MLEQPKPKGNADFFMFGEVFDADPCATCRRSHDRQLPATLDFGFQAQSVNWVAGKSGTDLRDLFADDDYYTDTDSNAYELPTFLGNHDMGRVAMLLKGASADDAELMRRVKLAALADVPHPRPADHLLRRRAGLHGLRRRQGRPAGHVRDPGRRATATERCSGDTSGAKDRFNTERTALPAHQGAVARCARPTRRSPTVRRSTATPAATRASSRSPASTRASSVEYVVALNNATTAEDGDLRDLRHNQALRAGLRHDDRRPVRQGRPAHRDRARAQSVSVWKATSPMDTPKSAPAGLPDRRRAPVTSSAVAPRSVPRSPTNTFAQVTLACASGRDDRLDRARHRRQRAVPRLPRRGRDGLAQGHAASSTARCAKDSPRAPVGARRTLRVVGDPKAAGGGGGGVGPVTQPDAVQRARRPQLRDGLPRPTGSPSCDARRQLTLDPEDQIWKGTYDAARRRLRLQGRDQQDAGTRTTAPAAVPRRRNIRYTAPRRHR